MADQGEETPYSRLVAQIAEIEAATKRQEMSTVDISDSFDSSSGKGTTSYQALLNVITEVERKGGFFQRQRPQAKPQEAEAKTTQPPEIPRPLAQPAQPQQQVPVQVAVAQQPSQQQVQIQATETQPQQQRESQKVYAGRELSELTKALPLHIPMFGERKLKKTNSSDLILPNLSISDQIAELERILDGIKSGAFGSDDLYTVRQEVYGLAIQVNSEKKELKRKNRQLGSDEYQLWTLRDQRIEDTLSAMAQKDKAG